MRVLLGLGSNIRPEPNMRRALEALARQASVQQVSRFWRTPPVGVAGHDFLNAVAVVYTSRSVRAFRHALRDIEASLGRVRTADKYAARVIDLDLLAIERVDWHVVEPRLAEQTFHLHPISEILPQLVLPTGETVAHAVRLRPLIGARPEVDAPVASGGPVAVKAPG
jgi:2-amino-4-hydroxy-6-hydroxymethyldihydropteridine diphosphokinase